MPVSHDAPRQHAAATTAPSGPHFASVTGGITGQLQSLQATTGNNKCGSELAARKLRHEAGSQVRLQGLARRTTHNARGVSAVQQLQVRCRFRAEWPWSAARWNQTFRL